MHDNLLSWYDQNRRTLPWRALPGEVVNPYFVYLSEVMLQQTTVPTVINYFNRFIEKWPTIEAFSSASLDEVLLEWQGLGYYSRAKNLKLAIQRIISENKFPQSHEALIHYPGIGDYTSKAIAAICFNQPVLPVDGNVIRVFSRFFNISTPLPALKKEIIIKTEEIGAGKRPGDFAQALMDLGSLVCKPKNPKCPECPLMPLCNGYKNKTAQSLPMRLQKTNKPIRYGTAYLIQKADQIILEKRSDKGLLANLWGIPTSAWNLLAQDKNKINDQHNKKRIKHVFTHFTLYLEIHCIRIAPCEVVNLKANQKFVALDEIQNYALPTLMKKIVTILNC
jgi:A/G-specific adenine glycosylase